MLPMQTMFLINTAIVNVTTVSLWIVAMVKIVLPGSVRLVYRSWRHPHFISLVISLNRSVNGRFSYPLTSSLQISSDRLGLDFS